MSRKYLICLALSLSAWACAATWTGAVSSDFMDPNNWNPVVSLVGTPLIIGAGNPNDPVFNADMSDNRPGGLTTTTEARLTIAGGALYPYATSTLNGIIMQQAGDFNVRGNAYIGDGGPGTLTVAGGSFSYKNTLYIGRNAGGVGTLNVWGGNVWMQGQPVISSNGGTGRISIKNDRFIYCPGNQTAFFQNLVTTGKMTTDPGWTILINYDAGTNRTSITSTRTVGATEPQPANKAKEIPVARLKWRPGTSATGSRVFLGTDYTSVFNATTSTPGIYLGATAGGTWTLTSALTEGVTYYWRVDTVTATETRKGTVWSFTPVDVMPPRYMEKLGRGVIALYQGSGSVYVGWRLLASDPADVAFNLYRNGTKLNSTPITQSTNWSDTGVNTLMANTYYVKPVIGGRELAPSHAYTLAANPTNARYFTIPLNPVPGGDVYSMQHVFVGDLDGDGEYDFVVRRNNNALATYKVLEGYKRDGTFLWRVNLGPNVQDCYTVVYDFDQDGKAEVVTRTGEGTVFGDSTTIGDTDGDGVTDYRVIGRSYEIWTGPEFLSIMDGMTGAELSRTDFIPRGDINDWGDGYGNRMSMIREGVAYLDGVHPSIVFNRGPGDYMKMYAWDFIDGELVLRWTWFNNHHAGLPTDEYYSDFHQWRFVDLDGDGRDEINLGGSVIDDDGTPLYGTELSHGDRFSLTDFDPDRPGLEVFAIQQNNPDLLGMAYYDAATGAMIQKYYESWRTEPWDVGRGDAGDYDPDHLGIEFYSTMNGMYDCTGTLIYNEHPFPSVGIWWDGDLRREFFTASDGNGNNPVINKWNHLTKNSDRLFTIYSDNGSYSVISPDAGRPPFVGDIYGDWREEVVLEERDHSKLRVYSTTIPTTTRLYNLMQNPYYRVDVTHKGYIVTTYTDYYLGEGMQTPPTPYIRYADGGRALHEWWTGISGSAVSNLTSAAAYPNRPNGAQYLTSLETKANWADNYGARIRGYLRPEQSADYTFWIAADETAELWLSSDARPDNASRIAYVAAATNPRQWNKYGGQQSAAIPLVAGRKYYVEVLHKEAAGSDHAAVAWQMNGTDDPQVIDGRYLMPWEGRVPGDLTEDSRVNLPDESALAAIWLKQDCAIDLLSDMNGDCAIGLDDLLIMADHWLFGN
ncbi:MAG: hypothetical protein LLF76_03795 [Planctomycetaceae bacterium]|nr:hypothetical protein [Planctomycetaceae bacterium]